MLPFSYARSARTVQPTNSLETWDEICQQYHRMERTHSMQFVNSPPRASLLVIASHNTTTIDAIVHYQASTSNDAATTNEMNSMLINLFTWQARTKKELDDRDYIADYHAVLRLDARNAEARRNIRQFNAPASRCIII